MCALYFFSSLAGLLVLIWLLALISNNIGEQFSRDANRQQSQNESQRNTSFLCDVVGWFGEASGPIANSNEEDQKDRLNADMVLWTRAVARYTRALVFVGVIGSIIAAGTLLAIKDQLNATFNDARPWIKVEGMINQSFPIPLDLSRVVSAIPFTVRLTNTGKSPAFNVRVLALSFVPHPGGNMAEAQRKRCKELSAIPLGDWNNGHTIFPNDSVIDGEGSGPSGPPMPGIDENQIKLVPEKMDPQIYIFGAPIMSRPSIRPTIKLVSLTVWLSCRGTTCVK